MRFISLALIDFKLLKDSAIRDLTITFNEDIQIFIGPNGSGKSSVQAQLDPYPVVRSLFGKEGLKRQVIEKDGKYYRLESEYEKPSSPHAFYEGDSDENLNVGCTTETQKELIVEHLGITPLVDSLIMNKLNIPKMTLGTRKEFLMSSNPDQIGFITPLIKDNASKIKACKNNISRLQSRKILLEQEMLDEETVVKLTQEKAAIDEDLSALQQNSMDIDVGLRSLDQTQTSLSLNDLPNIKKTIKRHRYTLSKLPHVHRRDHTRQHDKEVLMAELAMGKQRLIETDEQITTLSNDLSEMERRYRDLTLDGDLQAIDQTIERLENERSKLKIEKPIFEVSKEELQQLYGQLDGIRDALRLFDTLSVKLVPAKKRKHREQMLSSSLYKQTSWRSRLSDLETQYDEWIRRHTLSPSDIPESPCAKNRCPLYAHFMEDYTSASNKRTSLLASIEKGRRKIARLDRYVHALTDFRDQSKPYVDRINWLVGQAQSNPILHHVLRQMDILSVVSTNPNRIVKQITDVYDHISQWHKLKIITADLDAAYILKSRQISSESHDTIKLVANIEKTKKTLHALLTTITTLSTKNKTIEAHIFDITTFNTIKQEILDIQKHHDLMRQAFINRHEKDKLLFLRRGIESLRSNHFLRMSEIERTLKAQSGLKERYQEEVLSQIGVIEKELADLQQIQTALIAIPKENMISFINDIFDQANRLIETIWTLPLKIGLLKPEDPLNYEFMVLGDNHSIREMSECSEGQTEILSLALNLALRLVLRHLNLPLALDEPGRTMDTEHRRNFALLLKRLLDDQIISQLFMVSHHAELHEAFTVSETLVLREENILLPSGPYNLHVTMA